MNENLLEHSGGCHCGAVHYTIVSAAEVVVQRCNCSICSPCGYLHLIVPATRFTLHSGKADLIDYQFGSRTAHHLFCRHCGVKSFYVPRSNPDGYSINFNCLVEPRFRRVQIEDFDGRDWEKNARHLAGLSKIER